MKKLIMAMILGSAVASTGAFAAAATVKVADSKPATTVSKPAVKTVKILNN